MRSALFVLLIFIFGCQNNPRSKTNAVNQVETNVYKARVLLPQKVIDYINSNLTGWVIPDTSDYSKVWWSFYEKDQIPFAVSADINGDNLIDYGLILKQSNAIRLMVLLAEGESFKHWIDNNFKEPYGGNDIQFGLKIEPPGEMSYYVDGLDTTLRLERRAMALMNLEIKHNIYYWADGMIKIFRAK